MTTTTTTDARTPDKGTRPAINPWYDLAREVREWLRRAQETGGDAGKAVP